MDHQRPPGSCTDDTVTHPSGGQPPPYQPPSETLGHYGIAPPPYSPVDMGSQANNHGSQEEIIHHQITVVALEQIPPPCCSCCSWICWRRTQIVLAMAIFVLAAVKICLLIFSN